MDKWVRVFDVPDISKHTNGFTLYKIVSIVYPKSCFDAVTKVTVWKRYNECKKLHRQLKLRHKSMHIEDNDNLPNLIHSSYFKRFDKDVIEQRKNSILSFLDYVGQHPSLFKASEFVKFFETSHTPPESLNSNINIIRAQLKLPNDPEIIYYSDDNGFSDSDSVLSTTFSSSDEKQYPAAEINCYLTNAEKHVTNATECESSHKYEESFAAYKQAIAVLLDGVKEEKDLNSRRMVKYKIEKYLIRAEKIYNLYLSSEMKSTYYLNNNNKTPVKCKKTTSSNSTHDSNKVDNNLFNYKILKVIDSGMVVLDKSERNIFYLKVIEKGPTTLVVGNNSVAYLNIPKCQVPYMVKFYRYYDCSNAVFILTQYVVDGENLLNHISKRKGIDQQQQQQQVISNECLVEEEEEEEDLINDYTKNNQLLVENEMETNAQILNRNQRTIINNSEDVLKWASQLLIAIEQLHNQNIIISDLNPRNLLIDEKGNLVLTFQYNRDEWKYFHCRYEPYYCAPEVFSGLLHTTITQAVDWWSFGAILFQLLTGMPLKSFHPEGIWNYTILKIPKYVSAEGKSLLRQLLVYEPDERLRLDDLKSHPFFNNVNWIQLRLDAYK